MFIRFFVDRPIFATVLSVMITLAGGVAAWTLPISQYPEITPPTVEVSAVYPGANSLTIADTVAAPIEQQVNGVEEMAYMSSRSTNDGSYALTVTFKPGADLNTAQVLVQNRVNLATPVLPDIVKRRGVLVKKKSPTVLMIINLFSKTGDHNDLYLSNYATLYLRDELTRLSGVGDVTYLGQRDYSMRLWLDPQKLAVRGLTANDVVQAIEQQNTQVAAGQIGQPPVPDGQVFQYVINTLGRLSSPQQFEEMVLRADDAGRIIRLSDVARVELGATSYDQTCTLDGQPSVALSIYQLPGSNALATARRIREKIQELRPRFPAGLDYAIVYDTTPFIEESVHEVIVTLLHAVLLVSLVMLVFLRSWRAAIIPLAAVPVATIGTFTALSALGYSLNNLTLFGLVLAVGIVVDDAIVVVEAVQHHIDNLMSPREATLQALEEVAGPVIAVGLVLAAVFVPCIFITGIVGQFFRQFAVTIAISTLISAFNSLTLSPALCALLLRSRAETATTAHHEGVLPRPKWTFAVLFAGLSQWYLNAHCQALFPNLDSRWALTICLSGGFGLGIATGPMIDRLLESAFAAFHAGFSVLTEAYLIVTRVMLRGSIVVLIVYGLTLGGTYVVLQKAPAGFIPNQDKGYLLINVQLPDSASAGRTAELMQQVDEIVRRQPGVKHSVSISGQSVLLGANSANFGTVYVLLDLFAERLTANLSADAINESLQTQLSGAIPGALINVFGAPAVDGLGAAGGLVLVVADPLDAGAVALEQAARLTADTATATPEIQYAFTGARADTPWLRLVIDRVAAKSKGVSVSEIANALQVNFGSFYVNDFNWQGRTWQVNVQAEGRFRERLSDLKQLQVASASKQMVPLGSVLRIEETTGPVTVQRYNLYPATTVTVTPAAGVSSGAAMTATENAATAALPVAMRSEWTELALLQKQTKNTASQAFVLAVLLAFLVLAAQYESWSLPLAVILVVPLCLLSATVGVRWAGHDINIFTQIGFVVLVGLACKNAILIVEFAKHRREAGIDCVQATLDACRLRLRPIIMTSVAFILGVLPLVTATGAGAEMRRPPGNGGVRRDDWRDAVWYDRDAGIFLCDSVVD